MHRFSNAHLLGLYVRRQPLELRRRLVPLLALAPRLLLLLVLPGPARHSLLSALLLGGVRSCAGRLVRGCGRPCCCRCCCAKVPLPLLLLAQRGGWLGAFVLLQLLRQQRANRISSAAHMQTDELGSARLCEAQPCWHL